MEPGRPRARDYAAGAVMILGLTAIGITVFGVNWHPAAGGIWLWLDLILFASLGTLFGRFTARGSAVAKASVMNWLLVSRRIERAISASISGLSTLLAGSPSP